MPYQKTKEGRLVNEITLGDGYPLSNDLQPLKIGGKASIVEISHPLPDGSDNGLFKVNGDLDITGTLKTKLSHDLIYDFDDEVNTLAQAKIDALVDSAPAALDTLNELAAALNDDANFATTVTNSLATKVGLTGTETIAGLKTFSSSVTIHTATDALLNLKTSDDSWAYVQFLENDGSRRAFIGMDNDLDTLRINATENGANEIQIDTTTVDMNANVDISGDLTVDTSTLKVDSSNNRVGIGVTDPDSKVEIIGEGTSNSTKSLEIKDSGGTNLFYVRDDGVVSVTHNYLYAQASGGIYSTGSIKARGGITDDGGALGLGGNGNTDDMTISSGNVGIGTTSPDEKLHVASETDPTLVLQCPTNNQTNSGTISFRESGTTDRMAIKYNGSTNNLIIDTESVSNAFVLQRADGHIGIGTDSPTTTLDVEGTVSYKETTLSASSDAFDVSDATVVKIDTSGGTILLGGFSGGVAGQVIHLAKTASSNSIRIENNESTGTQKIFTSSGSDKTISGYGGLSMYCDGTSWYTLDS